jgi:hypothetical protein
MVTLAVALLVLVVVAMAISFVKIDPPVKAIVSTCAAALVPRIAADVIGDATGMIRA